MFFRGTMKYFQTASAPGVSTVHLPSSSTLSIQQPRCLQSKDEVVVVEQGARVKVDLKELSHLYEGYATFSDIKSHRAHFRETTRGQALN